MLDELRAYGAYVDSGINWIGEVPKDWEALRAKHLFREINRRSEQGAEQHLSMSQVLGLVPSNLVAKSLESESYEGAKVVAEGDLVLNRLKAHLAVFSVAPMTGVVSPDYSVFRLLDPSDTPQYFEQLFKTPTYLGELRRRVKGIVEGFYRLYSDDFLTLPIFKPPPEVQRRIVSFLDEKTAEIDEAIGKKRRLIELLNEQKAILINQAVTRGLDPSVPMKDSGVDWIGEIPAHWDLAPLRALFSFRNEKNDPVKTENILSLSIAHGVTPYSEEGRGGNKRKDDLTAYKLAYPGDIVMNSMNVIVGAVGLSNYFGAISPVYYALYPGSDHVHVPFFEKIFLNAGFQRGLYRYGKGILIKLSGTGKLNTIRMKISTNDLKNLPLPLPPLDDQVRVVAELDARLPEIDAAIESAGQQISRIEEFKQTLIANAVTGKIKI